VWFLDVGAGHITILARCSGKSESMDVKGSVGTCAYAPGHCLPWREGLSEDKRIKSKRTPEYRAPKRFKCSVPDQPKL
jgi:hypothetical protein